MTVARPDFMHQRNPFSLARHINNDPARENIILRRKFMSKSHEFTSIYAENQIRTDRSLDDSWILSRAGPKKVSRSISETVGSRRIAHAAKNYRPDLKSNSYLFREKRERKGGEIWDPTFGGETLDKLLHPLPFLSPFSLRAFGTRLKNPLNLWPRRNRSCICLRFHHQSRVLIATGVRELRSAIYRG